MPTGGSILVQMGFNGIELGAEGPLVEGKRGILPVKLSLFNYRHDAGRSRLFCR